MSAHRESFKNRGIRGEFAQLDFPIPDCAKCKKRMVRVGGRWNCTDCTPLGVLYPNRAARRRAGL